MAITQSEYEYLIKQEKGFDDYKTSIKLGPAPIKWTRQINSLETKEIFLLDFYRGSFELSKYTYNKRYRQTIILFRYDNGGRHTNPDGITFDGPHIHLYREGYNDKFAFPISKIGINKEDSIEKIFTKLMYFCNIKRLPSVEFSIFD